MTASRRVMLLMRLWSLRELSLWRSKGRAFQFLRSLLTLLSLTLWIVDTKLCVRARAMLAIGRRFVVLPLITDSAVIVWGRPPRFNVREAL
jgi:hypothetical protein